MFSVIPNRKNYCLYFTVCAHYPRLPNVFSSNVRSSKYLIITELICSKAQKPELLKARIAQMLELSKAPKGLNARIAQCSNAQCSNAPKCSKSPVPCKNSKFKNSKLRQSRNNSKFKTQNSKLKSHLITFSTSSMFLSNGPLCSSFSVHMAAANLPASVMLSPCERQ